MSKSNKKSEAGKGDGLTQRLADLWLKVMTTQSDANGAQHTATPEAPVVWLLGNVQSGKSSIVQALTGQTAAEVGAGYRACTKASQIYDFPNGAPIIRFLDTRGLGEASYDPQEDLTFAEQHAHLLLVAMRAMDHNQGRVLAAVRDIRSRHPDWPIVVAQTCLHEGYPHGMAHIRPYPFDGKSQESLHALGVPEDLRRSLFHQRGQFDSLAGQQPPLFVAIDFTLEGDGFEPRHYGLEALQDALMRAAPAALGAAVKSISEDASDQVGAEAQPQIMAYAMSAAAADAVPVAGAFAVPGIQARLLYSIGRTYGVEWDRQTLAEFGGCLGSSVVARLIAAFGIRQVTKLVPIYGQTIGAAAAAATSFATTFALGKAACFFIARRRHGKVDADAVARTYSQSLHEAFQLAKRHGFGAGGGDNDQKAAR